MKCYIQQQGSQAEFKNMCPLLISITVRAWNKKLQPPQKKCLCKTMVQEGKLSKSWSNYRNPRRNQVVIWKVKSWECSLVEDAGNSFYQDYTMALHFAVKGSSSPWEFSKKVKWRHADWSPPKQPVWPSFAFSYVETYSKYFFGFRRQKHKVCLTSFQWIMTMWKPKMKHTS